MIEIELPDGSIAEFPDGTSDKVITGALKQQSNTAEATSRLQKMASSPLGKARMMGYGAERALDEAAMGLKQMTAGLSPEETRDLEVRREMEKLNPAGSWQSRLPAEALLLGAPANKIQAGIQGAKVLPAALAKWGGAAAGGAAAGASRVVDEGETRGGNATEGAVFGLAGQAGGDLVGRGVDGVVKMSQAARALPKAVQAKATLGQLADRTTTSGRAVSALEEKAKSLPIAGEVVGNQRQRGVDAWREDVLEKASPMGFKAAPADNFRDRIGATADEFSKRYTDALKGKSVRESDKFLDFAEKMLNDPRRGLSATEIEQTRRAVMGHYDSMYPGARGGPEKFYHGGSFEGTQATKPLYLTRDKEIAESYVDMSQGRFGKGSLQRIQASPQKGADPELVRKIAAKHGIAVDDYTPASMFDVNLHGTGPVNKLVAELKKEGYDHAILDDIGFGIQKDDKPVIMFTGSPATKYLDKFNTAERAKKFESFLSSRARDYGKGQGPLDPEVGRLYRDLERAWEAVSRRDLGREARAKLKPLDEQYAKFKTVERAAGSVANDSGAFTPAQLTNSVAARTGKSRFAKGEGLLADEARTGKAVFQDHLPNSGTAERVMQGTALGGLVVDPLTTAGMVGGSALAAKLANVGPIKRAALGDTKVQRMLQAMRAQDAARQLGLPGGVMSQEFLDN
jgi:hypothetical protein